MNRNEHLQKQVNETRYFIGHGFIRTVKFLESCPFRTFAEPVMCNRDDIYLVKGILILSIGLLKMMMKD